MNHFSVEYAEAASALAVETGALLATAQADPAVTKDIATAYQTRWGGVADVRALASLQPYLAELPETAATEVYERAREAERRWASPTLLTAGYAEGVATEEDEIRVAGYGSPVLVDVGHATDVVRAATGKREDADHGTAALAVLLAEDGLVDAVIPVGRQTGNPNVDMESAHKRQLAIELARWERLGFVSLHGKVPGHVGGLLEDTEIHAFLGLGAHQPSAATLAAAKQVIAAARDELGLRVEIANKTPFLLYENDPLWRPGMSIRDKSDQLKIDPTTGLPKVNYPEPKLAALKPGMTTNFVHEWLGAHPDHPDMVAFQVELSRSLRLTPQDTFNRDPKAMAMGVYFGYLLSRRIAEICRDLPTPAKV